MRGVTDGKSKRYDRVLGLGFGVLSIGIKLVLYLQMKVFLIGRTNDIKTLLSCVDRPLFILPFVFDTIKDWAVFGEAIFHPFNKYVFGSFNDISK